MSESPQGRKTDRATGVAIRRAVTLHRAGRLGEALARYDSVLAVRPGDPDALNLSAVALFQLGDAAGAEERLLKAVERAPDYAEAFSNLCSAPGSLDTSLSHAAGLIEIAACHA